MLAPTRPGSKLVARPIRLVAILGLLCTLACCFLVARADNESLNAICKSKLSLKTLDEFRKFVDELKSLPADASEHLARGHSHLKKCLEEKDSILSLSELIETHDKRRPCKLSEVTKLENYARKHLLNNKRAMTLKFFSLFGVTIGIYCKINLLTHLKQADLEADQVDFIYSMASPTGWNTLINEYTKKSMKFGTSGHQDSHVINRIAKLVPGLSQVDHLDLMNFNHVMNDEQARAAGLAGGIESGEFEMKNSELRSKIVEALKRILQSCQNLDKFYVNSVLSMAKLKELGLLTDVLNDLHEHSALLHKWLAVTSFCQLMARVRVVENDSTTRIKLEVVHDDKLLESRRALYSYAAPFSEIHELAHELVWQASVNEGAWRQKSVAMWPPVVSAKKESPERIQSSAMKQLGQFVKGVEHDFQSELEEEKSE